VKLPWLSRFIGANGALAAEARVELVLVDLSAGANRRRLLRQLPPQLAAAVERLQRGPSDSS
jgi:acyl-CoA thioester hydrolase